MACKPPIIGNVSSNDRCDLREIHVDFGEMTKDLPKCA